MMSRAKAYIIKAGTIGMSMRRQPVSTITTNNLSNSPAVSNSTQADYEDYIIYEIKLKVIKKVFCTHIN